MYGIHAEFYRNTDCYDKIIADDVYKLTGHGEFSYYYEYDELYLFEDIEEAEYYFDTYLLKGSEVEIELRNKGALSARFYVYDYEEYEEVRELGVANFVVTVQKTK